MTIVLLQKLQVFVKDLYLLIDFKNLLRRYLVFIVHLVLHLLLELLEQPFDLHWLERFRFFHHTIVALITAFI